MTKNVNGYYCLATGAVAQAPGKVRRNMPDPIPVMIIGRGMRAVLVHATSGKAKAFYEKCGFFPSPVDPMILMVILAEVKAILSLCFFLFFNLEKYILKNNPRR